MKQDALKTLCARLGFDRGLFETTAYAGCDLTPLRRVFALLQDVGPVETRHDALHRPPFPTPVVRESPAELQAAYPDDDPADLRAYADAYLPHETVWAHLHFVERKQEREVRVRPFGAFVLADFATDVLHLPRHIHDRDDIRRFLEWIGVVAEREIAAVMADPAGYRARIERRLPYRERFGKALRRHMWACVPGRHHLRDELSDRERADFRSHAPALTLGGRVRDLTAGEFLRWCLICHAGAGMAGPAGKSAAERYLMHADGRHDGLTDLPPDDPAAFHAWIKAPKYGHPWEIARGGNSTHVSLRPLCVHDEDRLYEPVLEGSATIRSAETIRMALALREAGVPVRLADVDAHLLRMVGDDWIGVLPDDFFGARRPADFFPGEDRMYDGYTYSDLIEPHPALAPHVVWSPLDLPVPTDRISHLKKRNTS